ncbi:MAG: 8-amino-7-oxononanoate synthase [Planctomycetes bacterium]|nr:8-amino-7-oxononanoate synthase [Planctomycetota bacterium]
MTTDQTASNEWLDQLEELDAQGLRRRLRRVDSAQGAYVTVDGRRMCCFASNNYLGLANHPRVVAAVRDAVERWGWGAAASRLITGHMGPHEQLEARLAAFKGTPAALVCATGYQANLAAVRGLAGVGDMVMIDKLDHASIVDAARGCGAVLRVFPHRDYAKLERILRRAGDFQRRIIVTDSLFSMDGDFADLPRLVELKRRYDALLCIDEAHATGVFGEHGRGAAEAMGVEHEIDLVVGTLSKALGGIGGFVAGRAEIIDWLINTAGPFIYTTALPPAACAAAMAALDIVEHEPGRRQHLLELAAYLRHELAEVRGLDIAGSTLDTQRGPAARSREAAVACQGSTSQIVPLIVGDAREAVRLADTLADEGLLALPIRPPTVPRGTARLRISLCCEHTKADVDRLLAAVDRHWPRAQ